MIRLPRVHINIPLKTSVHAYVPEYEVPLVLALWRLRKKPDNVQFVGERGPHVEEMPKGMRPEALTQAVAGLEAERRRLMDPNKYGASAGDGRTVFETVYPSNGPEDTFAIAFRKTVEKEAKNPFNPEKELTLQPSKFLTAAGIGERLALELTKRGLLTLESVRDADFLKLCEVEYLTPASAKELQAKLTHELSTHEEGEPILLRGFEDVADEAQTPVITGEFSL